MSIGVRHTLGGAFCIFFSVASFALAAVSPIKSTPAPQQGTQGAACPQQVAGTHGVKLLGANTIVSDIVINACVAMGEDGNALRGGRGGNVCALTSGYRSASHNASVGGASQSQHVQANAIDIVLRSGDVVRFGQLLHAGLCCKNSCLGGLGYYNGNKYHVDNRKGVAAWGPGYSRSGIPQITNAGVRQLLNTHLQNSGSIQLPGGTQVNIATGDITTPQGVTSPQQLFTQLATQGQNEDGNWATNPMQAYQPSVQQQQQQIPQQQQAPQQQYNQPQQAPVQYPIQQQSQYPTQPQNAVLQTTVPADTEYPLETSAKETIEPKVMFGEGAYIRCEPSALARGEDAQITWSCGKTSGTIKVVGRGFNPRNSVLASARVSPVETEEFGLSCYSNGKRFVQKTCTIEVDNEESRGTFTVKSEQASLPSIKQGKFCVFGFCFFSQ